MKLSSRYLLALTLLLLYCSLLSAQDDASKDKELKRATPAKAMPQKKEIISKFRSSKRVDEVELLLNQAERNSVREPKQALDYVAEALARSINENNPQGEARSYQVLGNINYQQALYAKAVENYQKALDGFKALGEASHAYETRKKLAAALEANRELPNALTQWNEVQQEATETSRTEDIVQAKTNIARIYEKQGKQELALQHYKEVLKMEEQRGNDKGVIDANNSIGSIYLQQERKYGKKSSGKKHARVQKLHLGPGG